MDLKEAIERGKHKSARSREADLKLLVHKDIVHGFQLPITPEAAMRIPHVYLAPYGIVEQSTLDEHGNLVPKLRLVHDQSFKTMSGHLVNSRIN